MTLPNVSSSFTKPFLVRFLTTLTPHLAPDNCNFYSIIFSDIPTPIYPYASSPLSDASLHIQSVCVCLRHSCHKLGGLLRT